jgi:hypothetical protein
MWDRHIHRLANGYSSSNSLAALVDSCFGELDLQDEQHYTDDGGCESDDYGENC